MEDKVNGNAVYGEKGKVQLARLRNNKDILIKVEINRVEKTIENCLNCLAVDRDRQTDRHTCTLNYETSAVWGTKPRTTANRLSTVSERGQVMRLKTLRMEMVAAVVAIL